MPESRCVTSTVACFGKRWHVWSGLTLWPPFLFHAIQEKASILCALMNIFVHCVSVVVHKTYEGVSGKELQWKSAARCSAGHGELTVHAGINKCTGVTVDHVKKHLGAVCVCVCVCVYIYAGITVCVCEPTNHILMIITR